MQLNNFTDYCLRVLIHVGTQDETLTTIDEVAESYGISRSHLTKVVYRLGQLGYLETIRGRNGGVRLARRPKEINIGKVIRETEHSLAIVECLKPGNDKKCRIQTVCVLKKALQEALAAYLSHMDRYTLADLLQPRTQLKALLRLA